MSIMLLPFPSCERVEKGRFAVRVVAEFLEKSQRGANT